MYESQKAAKVKRIEVLICEYQHSLAKLPGSECHAQRAKIAALIEERTKALEIEAEPDRIRHDLYAVEVT
jgi:hypothetical protein